MADHQDRRGNDRWARSRLGLLLALTAVLFAVGVAPASAAYVHTVVTGEYGKEGPKTTGLGAGCRIAYNSVAKHLYLASEGKIYGLAISPGTATPLGGEFPIGAGTSTGCGEPDMAVESSGSGNIYAVGGGSSDAVYGWGSSGSPLGSPWPVPLSGEICGVDTGPSGGPWAGNYTSHAIVKYSPSGTAEGSISVGFSVCKLAVDHSNGDVYAASYGGGEVAKFTAASGYTEEINFPSAGGEPGLAVDGAEHKLYVGNGTTSVEVYNTETANLIETITLPEAGGQGVAVNEANDTLFVTVGSGASGYIQERPGIVVPDVSTSETTGFATLHGHVDPAGGGEVTNCFFEYSTNANYSGASTIPCSPAPNYSTAQDVEANLTGLVTGETLYHFRLVAGNANGTNKSNDRTFTPHFVAGLHTDAASRIERTSATLNGSFLGNGEDTTYYFKWGTSTSYGHTTAVEDAGSPTGPNTIAVSTALGNVLEPQTLYHYRVVATNGNGTSEANDETFTTKPAVTGLTTEAASEILTNSADLNAAFTGDGLDTKYYFEWGSSTSYGNKTEEGEIIDPSGSTTIPAAAISGLQPLHTYHYRVVAENSYGVTKGADRTFTTFTAPQVVAQSSSGVNGTKATLQAVINPHGAEAEYHFEYGPTTAYGTSVPVPDAHLAASETNEPVEVHLTGLNGGVYHFRLTATNQYGTTVTKDQTFNFFPPVCPNSTVRQQTGSDSLPDCRAYELVTPEDQGITIIYPATLPFSSTATSPSRLAFVGAYGLIPESGEPLNNLGDVYVSTRTSQGWKTKYVGIPSSEALWAGGPPWRQFSDEPDKFDMYTLSNPSLSKIVDWNDGIYKNGELFEAAEHANSSNAPYLWNSETGKQLDRWPTNVATVPGGEHFKGRTDASADLSHFVFSSNVPFAPGGEPGDVYDNDTVNDTISIVSVKEGGVHIKNSVPLATSENGSHILTIVRSSPSELTGPGQLFLRINDATTEEIAPGKSVEYLAMTPDGKKIYFTSAEQLLPEDEDTSTDLYMWSEESTSPNHLVLISKGNEPTAGNTDACSASWTTKCGIKPISFTEYTSAQGGSGGSPFADNFVAPENGDIYFLSPEQLAGSNGVNGQENLYDYRGSKLQFVAALEPGGIACTLDQGGQICSENAVARMETTPNDEYMAFLTGSKVTAYNNAGHSEMYLWRPEGEEMTCVSCIPTGAAPSSDVTGSHNGRYLTNDGRAFFETSDALVPQDTNEAADVYEYVDGRPQLITSGTNPGNKTSGLATIMALPGLVGVSADGTDVYFATYDTLVGQDRNGEAIKIYDARSSGGFQYSPPPPPCVAADECHGPGTSAPPPARTGTSAELEGSGNLQAAKRMKKKKAGHQKKRQKTAHRTKAHNRKAHRAAQRRHGNG